MKTESVKNGHCALKLCLVHFQLSKRGPSVVHIPSSIEEWCSKGEKDGQEDRK